MRYRLFGRDGINDREFQKLVDMDVITATGEQKVKVKKKVKKWAFDQSTAVKTEWEEDMSGSGSDTYDIKTIPIYNDNAVGDHI